MAYASTCSTARRDLRLSPRCWAASMSSKNFWGPPPRAARVAPVPVAEGSAGCRAVPGRFERVDEGQPFAVVVDYAHTDDALRNTIATARELTPRRVITLFGCGGDRDRA